jgi:signal transduction histidine kinase
VDIPVPIEKLERLAELTRGLSEALEGDSYLRLLVTAAAELTGSETAAILDFDREAGQLRFAVLPAPVPEALASFRIPVNGSLEGRAALSGMTMVIPDLSREEGHFRPADGVRGAPARSMLAVPIKYAGQVLGIFEALNRQPDGQYSGGDIMVMETLAALTASALETDLLERRIKHSLEDMTRLDRLKSDFIGISSHELRTPLGLILGHATFLREILDEQYVEQVEAIIRNASKLKEIIENLANVDNYQAGTARVRLRRISLRQIVEEVASSFEPFARQKAIELKTALPEDELMVEAEGSKIAIALSNLVKNALTFTNEGGHVLMSAESVPGYVKVSVADDGIGIPAAELPRIFERFFQVESHLTRRYGGMGLGLSVARAMIDMHGGRIWAESLEGKGSTFSFLLPVDHPKGATERPFPSQP